MVAEIALTFVVSLLGSLAANFLHDLFLGLSNKDRE